MNKRWMKWVNGWVMVGMMVMVWGCGSTKPTAPTVVCTTSIVADLVRQVVSGNMEVISLMGPGVDPHLYKVTEGDLRRLSDADVIFYNGLHLEAKMTEVLEKLDQRKPVYAITAGIPKTAFIYDEEYGEFPDPHVWFDTQLWIKSVQYVTAVMATVDPEHKTDYKKSGYRYVRQLESLDHEMRSSLATIPKNRRVLITAHDAFGYFAKAYDFQVKALQGISTESEAGVRDVRDLSEYIVRRKIPAVFVESSVPQRYMQALVEATRAKKWELVLGGELFSDALGVSGTPEGTYEGVVRHNVSTIVNALK